MQAHIIGQSNEHSLNECVVVSYYLLPPVNHPQADLFSCHNYNDRIATGQSKAICKLHRQSAECLECRNSKPNRQNLHTFKCKYLCFNTAYWLETLGINFYYPSLLACKVSIKTAR